jgi:hypothetical protein
MSVIQTVTEATSTTTETPIPTGLNCVSIDLISSFDKWVSKESANATTQQQFNSQFVNYSQTTKTELDPNTYLRTETGNERSQAAARQTLSRDVRKVAAVINSISDPQQQAVAL